MVDFLHLVLASVLGLAVFFDLKERRIPNWLIASGLVGGIVIYAPGGSSELARFFIGFFAGIIALIIPFAFRWLGAGDVKFFGLLGALLGAEWLPRILFYSVVIAGAMALAVVLFGKCKFGLFKTFWTDCKLALLTFGRIMPDSIRERNSNGASSVPWGVAMGAGTVMAYYLDPNGNWAGF